jgi:hypothetical protein
MFDALRCSFAAAKRKSAFAVGVIRKPICSDLALDIKE